MRLVIDASFIASLLLPDEAGERSALLLGEIKEGGAVAPTLWQLEIVNMLMTAERRKRLNASEVNRLLEAIDALPVTLQPGLTSKQRGDLVHLARKHALTAYDAAYLELALRLDLPLATVDASLVRSAKAEGAQLVR
jgi:predicted nucleic acid-binding protein